MGAIRRDRDAQKNRTAARAKLSECGRGMAWLSLLLAWIAGFVDAIGFLALFDVFTANMSGNSIAFGALLAEERWAEAIQMFYPIPWFVVGVVLGTVVLRLVRRSCGEERFAHVFALEAGFIIAYLILGEVTTTRGRLEAASWRFYTLIILPTMAMGLQASTLRKIAGESVRTTFVTGMLTSFGRELVTLVFWFMDRNTRRPHRLRRLLLLSWREPAFRRMSLCGAIWLFYIVGAMLGGWAWMRWGLRGLVLPAIGLTVATVVETRRYSRKTAS